MNRSPVSSSQSKGQPTITGDISMPTRDEVLVETLRDASLTWSSSRSRQHETWKSDARSYILSPSAGLDDGLSPRPHRGFGIGGVRPALRLMTYAQIDWHTVETETLRTTTDALEVVFTKTHVNAYSHQFRQGTDKTSYVAEFRSLDDKDQRVRVEESQCPALARIFQDIAKRIN